MKKNKKWYMYVVSCCDKSLYCGITTDIERRLKQHNGVLKGGAKYTRSRRPVLLVWKEICISRSDALKKEIKFKKLNKHKKLIYIRKNLISD